MPKKIDESQVKFLINKANIELEAHKYKKSKKTCYQALKLDSENPVIYLILLLAQNKVTEIEDLKNCEIDYESKSYKYLRRYAGKDLHEKLNKYLSDKEKYENIIVNNNKSPSLIKRFKTCIIEPVTKFINSLEKEANQKKQPKSRNPKQQKQSISNYLTSLPNIIKDFYSDKREGIEYYDIFNLSKFHNKVVRHNNSQKANKDLLNQLSVNETVNSASTYIYIIILSLQFFIQSGALGVFLSDKNYIGLLCAILNDLLLLFIIKKNYLRILKLKEITNTSVVLNTLRSIISFILSVVLLFTNYYLYFESHKNLFDNFYLNGLLFGITGSLIVNYLYIQIYYCLRFFNVVRLHKKI
jgi:hypothetical protein